MCAISLFKDTRDTLVESTLPPSSLSIETPRGTLASTLSCNGCKISSTNPKKIVQLSTHSHIGIWDNKLMHTELLRMQYCPVIPAHMHVSYCWAYVWRIQAKKNLSSIDLDCFLTSNTSVTNTDIQTGEGLYSICAFFEEDSIYIGTEDEDFLYQRAEINLGLPSRYVKEGLLDYNYQTLISSNEHSIHIHFPPPKAGELIQLQFVIAGGKDATSNWFAVEANPKDILMQANCK